jgi:hypothetical protein
MAEPLIPLVEDIEITSIDVEGETHRGDAPLQLSDETLYLRIDNAHLKKLGQQVFKLPKSNPTAISDALAKASPEELEAALRVALSHSDPAWTDPAKMKPERMAGIVRDAGYNACVNAIMAALARYTGGEEGYRDFLETREMQDRLSKLQREKAKRELSELEEAERQTLEAKAHALPKGEMPEETSST